MTWLTSDPHYYHANIIRYAKRPYIDPGDLTDKGEWRTKEIGRQKAIKMTQHMIQDHNVLVKPTDTVICVGDFTFGGTQQVIGLLRVLHGNYEFIMGNHDKALKDFKDILRFYPDLQPRVKFLPPLVEVTIEGQDIVLCHYAMKVWNKSHRGVWHLYGHSHGTLPDDPNSMSFDIGVDCHGLKPINMARIREIMSKKTYKPVDRHGAD